MSELTVLRKLILMMILIFACVSCEKDQAAKEYQEAFTLLKSGNARASLPFFEAAVSKSPGNLDYRLRYATALEDAGFFEKALNEYDIILQSKPDHILALVNLANAYRKQKEYSLALSHMKKAISLKKKEPWMLDTYGNILEEAGRLEEAYTYYGLAAKYEPNDPEFRNDLANVCMKLKKYDEARDLYIQLKKESNELYSLLASQEMQASEESEKQKYRQEKEPYLKSLNYYTEMLERIAQENSSVKSSQ